MNEELQLNNWWANLRITDKETIAGRNYPTCSVWWNKLDIAEKSQAYHRYETLRNRRVIFDR